MDALGRVAGPGFDLLDRVDAVLLAGGAPADDAILALLRRVGALPGDAFDFAVRLDPEPLRATAAELRVHAASFAQQQGEVAGLLDAGAWQGAGAEAFDELWHGLASHVGEATAADQPSLTGRLLATASYVDSQVAWIEMLRGEVAAAVTTVLASAEAVIVRTESPAAAGQSGGLAEAAARIGARVLAPFAAAVEAGHDLQAEWSPWLAELPYRPSAGDGAPGAGLTTRVEL